jgi:hypothetical protein
MGLAEIGNTSSAVDAGVSTALRHAPAELVRCRRDAEQVGTCVAAETIRNVVGSFGARALRLLRWARFYLRGYRCSPNKISLARTLARATHPQRSIRLNPHSIRIRSAFQCPARPSAPARPARPWRGRPSMNSHRRTGSGSGWMERARECREGHAEELEGAGLIATLSQRSVRTPSVFGPPQSRCRGRPHSTLSGP